MLDGWHRTRTQITVLGYIQVSYWTTT